MKRLIPAIVLICSVIAMGSITYSSDANGGLISWGPIEGEYHSLILRGSQEEYDGSDPDWGVVLAEIYPDSQGVFPESVMIAGSFVVVPSGCIACGICVSTCPVSAISQDEDGIAVIDADACIACGLCASACPVGTIYAPTANTFYGLFGKTDECGEEFLQGIEQ